MTEPDKLPVEEPAQRPAAPGSSPATFRRRSWLVLLLISLSILGLDQLSKRWAHQVLRAAPQGRINVVDDFLVLSYVRNPGAAWGFLAHAQERFRHPFFLGVSIAAMLFILYLHSHLEPGQHLLLIAISLIMGGAIGNFLDRLRLHYVIDFIELHWRHRYHWPTFNVADIAISIGVALLLLEMLFGPWWRRRGLARAKRAAGREEP